MRLSACKELEAAEPPPSHTPPLLRLRVVLVGHIALLTIMIVKPSSPLLPPCLSMAGEGDLTTVAFFLVCCLKETTLLSPCL